MALVCKTRRVVDRIVQQNLHSRVARQWRLCPAVFRCGWTYAWSFHIFSDTNHGTTSCQPCIELKGQWEHVFVSSITRVNRIVREILFYGYMAEFVYIPLLHIYYISILFYKWLNTSLFFKYEIFHDIRKLVTDLYYFSIFIINIIK